MSFARPVSVPQEHTECGDKNCPRHGPNRATSMGNSGRNSAPISGNKIPEIKLHDTSDCHDKNCPRHGHRSSSGSYNHTSTIKVGSTGASVDTGGYKKTSQQVFDKELDELVQRTQKSLRITAPVSKTGSTNNVVTFITNNSQTSDASYSMSRSVSPSVSPTRLSSSLGSSGMYDQMRMEHVMKENAVLQSITLKQSEEISQLQKQLEETRSKLADSEKDRVKLKIRVHDFAIMTQKWDKAVKECEAKINTLKSRLQYTDLKAKQLKRMASENAATASKWRGKAMDALQAQKDLEERKNAADRAAVGLYQQFREEKRKIVNLKRQHGEPITESDLDETISTTAGTLDTTMLEAMSPPSDVTINYKK